MTQHQAPEVTRELRECPWCALPFQGHFKVPGGAVFLYTVPDKHGPDCPMRGGYFESEEAAEAAWNTRATQPLSLTVDEILAIARLRELLAKATGQAAGDEWCASEDGFAEMNNIITYIETSAGEMVAYGHLRRGDRDLIVEAVNALPALLDRLQSLSLPVDIDRSGLAQEVD